MDDVIYNVVDSNDILVNIRFPDPIISDSSHMDANNVGVPNRHILKIAFLPKWPNPPKHDSLGIKTDGLKKIRFR